MTEPTVITVVTPPVATLSLNRPERLNAVNLELYEALIAALETIEADDNVKAIVLTGSGGAFCSGADLKAPSTRDLPKAERKRYVRTGQRANRALRRGRQPVVAAVNGAAVGAGLELALSCDFMVVANDAKLRLPEVALGTFVGGGVTRDLTRLVGLAHARELLLLGDFFTGFHAATIGLAYRAVPADEVETTALAVAQRLAAVAPIPLARMRKLLRKTDRMSLPRTLRAEARALEKCMASEDWKEGVTAFTEKRTPDFQGT